jgi:hypothetical protein
MARLPRSASAASSAACDSSASSFFFGVELGGGVFLLFGFPQNVEGAEHFAEAAAIGEFMDSFENDGLGFLGNFTVGQKERFAGEISDGLRFGDQSFGELHVKLRGAQGDGLRDLREVFFDPCFPCVVLNGFADAEEFVTDGELVNALELGNADVVFVEGDNGIAGVIHLGGVKGSEPDRPMM